MVLPLTLFSQPSESSPLAPCQRDEDKRGSPVSHRLFSRNVHKGNKPGWVASPPGRSIKTFAYPRGGCSLGPGPPARDICIGMPLAWLGCRPASWCLKGTLGPQWVVVLGTGAARAQEMQPELASQARAFAAPACLHTWVSTKRKGLPPGSLALTSSSQLTSWVEGVVLRVKTRECERAVAPDSWEHHCCRPGQDPSPSL